MSAAGLADIGERVRSRFPSALFFDRGTIEACPRVPGSYALLLRLDEPVTLSRSLVAGTLKPDWYLYAGSARGSGGLRARLIRHFRVDKPVRWHVDELTGGAAEIAALAIPDGSECDIVDELLKGGAFEPAIEGFGSSDCRACPAHLLVRPRSKTRHR